jgi:uncharacterized OsmC-like protein
MSLSSVIAGTRLVVTDNPALAHAVFEAQGTASGVTSINIRSGMHTFRVDEPATLGGTDVAPNPMQYALGALASCHAATYCYWSAILGIPFDSLTVRVEGDADIRGWFGLDDTTRPGFSAVRVSIDVDGSAGAERYAELAAAVREHCPILDVYRSPVPVTFNLTIAGEPVA